MAGTPFTSFTGTKVQILTQLEEVAASQLWARKRKAATSLSAAASLTSVGTSKPPEPLTPQGSSRNDFAPSFGITVSRDF